MPQPTKGLRSALGTLEFRCYLRTSGRQPGRWVAHCIDLDLWASGPSGPEAKDSLNSAILGYLRTVVDTEDKASIPQLLRRRAPWWYFAIWHLLLIWSQIRRGPGPLSGRPFIFSPPSHLGSVPA